MMNIRVKQYAIPNGAWWGYVELDGYTLFIPEPGTDHEPCLYPTPK